MRLAYPQQFRVDTPAISQVELNLECRDELIPILVALKYIYSCPEVRDRILALIERDLNPETSRKRGRRGFDYWQVLVLCAVRLGCNLNYDKLHDLAEQHRKLRQIMGIGDWDDSVSFGFRRIRDTICSISPETIDAISQEIVGEGHRLAPDAKKAQRADSFVAETNIHYPTDSSLILDGCVKIVELAVRLAGVVAFAGWRQHAHLIERVRREHLTIGRVSRHKGAGYKSKMKAAYARLIKHASRIVSRASGQVVELDAYGAGRQDLRTQGEALLHYLKLTEKVIDNARRRVLHDETVPNEEKVFSIHEPHTQLYRRGKAGTPNQFGRLVMIFEDAEGFVTHHYVMDRTESDAEVAVPQTKIVQERCGGGIESISFDRGFFSEENESELLETVGAVCLPKKHPKAFAKQMQDAPSDFRALRRRHPGVESAIGALQAGNGLDRSRDRSEIGFRRYIALGILGRNIHTLGKLLIRSESEDAAAGKSQRRSA